MGRSLSPTRTLCRLQYVTERNTQISRNRQCLFRRQKIHTRTLNYRFKNFHAQFTHTELYVAKFREICCHFRLSVSREFFDNDESSSSSMTCYCRPNCTYAYCTLIRQYFDIVDGTAMTISQQFYIYYFRLPKCSLEFWDSTSIVDY